MAWACAKSILLGEHAVVYGIPALVVGLGRGAEAVATRSDTARLSVGDRVARPGDGTELARAFEALVDSLDAGTFDVQVTLGVPGGVGLGASASIAVAAARSILEVAGAATAEAETERALEAAMAWERVFHGNPSGVDAWAAAYGGCFVFRRGEGRKPLLLTRPLPLAIAVAGPAASTKEMVEGVARLKEKKPAIVEKSFAAIESLVKNAALCVEAGDIPGLGKLMDLNQMLLSGLFLSTPALEKACAVARDAGAFGAKLTGAGGGGCVVALTADDPEPVLSAWRKERIECFASVVKSGEAPG